MQKAKTHTGTVKKFSGNLGWWYVSVPWTYDDLGIPKPKWGLVPAEFTVGKTTWRRSLLPMGDGSLFVALNAKVRRGEDIHEGDVVTIRVKVL